MAYKSFDIPAIGPVTIYKRRGARSMRLSVQPTGSIRVTIPTWTPYATGVDFVRSRHQWISQHQVPAQALLQSGQRIGKAHRLLFQPGRTLTSRVRPTEIVISYPADAAPSDAAVQQKARAAALRALRAEAEHLLPQRLQMLAVQHNFTYRSIGVRRLKSRWGSCDQHANIVLNIFLMQLPWHLIDYVLLHELTHTKIMQHGPRFWAAMATVEPKTPDMRKQMRIHQPVLQASI